MYFYYFFCVCVARERESVKRAGESWDSVRLRRLWSIFFFAVDGGKRWSNAHGRCCESVGRLDACVSWGVHW